MYRLLTIVGARPQFIKAAALSHAITEQYSTAISEDLLHTGQHYDNNMSGQFFTELDIPQPRYNLGVGSGKHGQQTAAMITAIEDILLAEHYDGMLVYGDTNSTLAGAIAASKLNIPIYHVEAGLRSFRRTMPEEINRVVTDHVSQLLFAPTQTAVENLKKEGFADKNIVFSGDVMLDNVLHYGKLDEGKRLLDDRYILATIHRDFNTDNPTRLHNILNAIEIAAEKRGCSVLLPLHPRTRNILGNETARYENSAVHIVAPLSYRETLQALHGCELVMTDSGGLQKEAYFSQRPCVVLRPETEWVEIVETGAAMLTDADVEKIVSASESLKNCTCQYPALFGDGHASEHIIEAIIKNLNSKK